MAGTRYAFCKDRSASKPTEMYDGRLNTFVLWVLQKNDGSVLIIIFAAAGYIPSYACTYFSR